MLIFDYPHLPTTFVLDDFLLIFVLTLTLAENCNAIFHGFLPPTIISHILAQAFFVFFIYYASLYDFDLYKCLNNTIFFSFKMYYLVWSRNLKFDLESSMTHLNFVTVGNFWLCTETTLFLKSNTKVFNFLVLVILISVWNFCLY